MIADMQALESSHTWELVPLPSRKKVVGCRWVYAIKVGFDDHVDRLKARLSLHQLDIKNAFLHGDLEDEVYMEQPPGLVAQRESGNDTARISQLKEHLCRNFQTKDLGSLKYFLGIEVAQSKDGVVISQRKYALYILQEIDMINYRPIDSPMNPNQKLTTEEGKLFSNLERYRRLVGKLIYLTITRLGLSFAVGVVSQFMQTPCLGHWNAIIRILRYLKKAPEEGLLYEDKGNFQIFGYYDADWAGSPIDRRSTTGYCVFLGGNVIYWKSKKQNVVAQSTTEAEYRAMASLMCELIWVKQFLQELNLCEIQTMKMYCDNQAALHIASNLVFHERTKHIEIDCHFVQEKLMTKEICTKFVRSNDQLAYLLIKSLRGPQIEFICSKLGSYNLYVSA
ncbi:uncharacterized protein LOC114184793 [Vigna unguiculata]|uniref:uncharacterized protein LOC114184793 n=1 Tax=Vigna unguiculata TaxID=3917 RepID=UPI001016A68D|nr:uncharacterized protein LOC114184793 [Vigna unguiculata]